MNAIVHRQKMNEDVAGFFTQIGELYVVHHIWGRRNHLYLLKTIRTHSSAFLLDCV